MEIAEHMVFAGVVPTSQFVLTLSTSDACDGQGVVSTTRWLFEDQEQAVEQTVKRWMGPFPSVASKLVLRRDKRVLFRGLVTRSGRAVLTDQAGCHGEIDRRFGN